MGQCWIMFNLSTVTARTPFWGRNCYLLSYLYSCSSVVVCHKWGALLYLSDFCHSWSVSIHLGIGWNGRKTQFTSYLKYQVFEQYWRTPSQYTFCESLRAIFHSNHPAGCVLTSMHFQPDQVFLAHYWESHHVKRPAKVQEVTCSFSPAHKTHLPVREGEQDEITWIVLDKPMGIVAYDHTNFKCQQGVLGLFYSQIAQSSQKFFLWPFCFVKV